MRTADPFITHVIASFREADLGFRFRFSSFPNFLMFLFLVFAVAQLFRIAASFRMAFYALQNSGDVIVFFFQRRWPRLPNAGFQQGL